MIDELLAELAKKRERVNEIVEALEDLESYLDSAKSSAEARAADCQDALSNILDAEEKIREALGDVEDTNLPYLSDVRAQADAAADMDTNVANL